MIEPRFGMFLGPDAQDAELTIDRAVTAERLGEGDPDDQLRRFAEDVVPAVRDG